MEADNVTTDPIDNDRQGNPGHQYKSICGAVLPTIFIRAHIVAL